jgi:uncharacterized circularly permuted ATP-grasp superfamily protein
LFIGSFFIEEAMVSKRAQVDAALRQVGITFAVYGDDAGTERLIPFAAAHLSA